MKSDLLSCPMCGSKAEMVGGVDDNTFFVQCTNAIDEIPIPDGVCGMEGRLYETRKDATEWWNARRMNDGFDGWEKIFESEFAYLEGELLPSEWDKFKSRVQNFIERIKPDEY